MRRLALVTVAVAAMVVAGCGDDGGGGGEEGGGGDDRVVELLMAEGESKESAECFADELSDFSAEDFESNINAESEDVDPEFKKAVEAATEVCDQATGGEADESGAGAGDLDGSGASGPPGEGDISDQVNDDINAELGENE